MTRPAPEVKALIPAAGRGTRLSREAGGAAKESLPVGGQSMIARCLAMTLASGVADVAVVVRSDKKGLIEQVEATWARLAGVDSRLRLLYQQTPQGVAAAMSLAEEVYGDHPLAVVMPDHLTLGGRPALLEMIEAYRRIQAPVIGAIEIDPREAGRFGAVGLMELGPAVGDRPRRVTDFSPKQDGPLEAPPGSRRFKGLIGVIYPPGWPALLRGLAPNFQGELDDTDIVLELAEQGRLHAAMLSGRGYDLGLPEGLAAARRDPAV